MQQCRSSSEKKLETKMSMSGFAYGGLEPKKPSGVSPTAGSALQYGNICWGRVLRRWAAAGVVGGIAAIAVTTGLASALMSGIAAALL